ncbi:uncharacterized protein LOC132265749 isoform X2 [Phlebotomus argentipes]|uniref:uncharacterized protein LOC132265749 isoform X2 n=1 Tax=Phlebotomus argentipes TaxID=94469 RepID=UPI002892D502|nr:uncharacterized protein LOC132265749 isoform X2 [Phlebotomus argentipes]
MSLKRKHLGDDSFTPKSKIYLKKTHKMLFQGANRKPSSDSVQSAPQDVLLYGNGEVRDAQTNTLLQPESLSKACSGCLKSATKFHSACVNCNLQLCEFCGHSCSWCRKGICESCINLYSCGSLERPICENCSIYQ